MVSRDKKKKIETWDFLMEYWNILIGDLKAELYSQLQLELWKEKAL